MRLGDTEVIVANYQDFVEISRYWQRVSVIPKSLYLGQKSRAFVALAHAASSIIIRDVD